MDKFWLFMIVLFVVSIGILGAIVAFVKEKSWPRLFAWILFASVSLAGLMFLHPQQAQVVYYKLALILGAAVIGYWLDRSLFPYARPDSYLHTDWRLTCKNLLEHGVDGEVDFAVRKGYELIFAAVMLRRTLIMIAVITGVTQGL